eukprot:gene10945-22857_t
MPHLRKESLIRAASSRSINSVSDSSDSVATKQKEDDKHGRAFQITEVLEWLGETHCLEVRSNRLTDEAVQNIAESLKYSLSLPCPGILRQLLYHADASTSCYQKPISKCKSMNMMLSTSVWMICTSSFEQLLVILYGLYDTNNENDMDKESMTALLTHLMLDECILNRSSPQKSNDMARVYDLVDELFEFSDASVNVSLDHSDSFKSDDSFDSVAHRLSPVQESSSTISCEIFVRYFTKKRRGSLCQLRLFQQKLQDISFGLQAWNVVRKWVDEHTTGFNLATCRFHKFHQTLFQELVKYMEIVSGLELIPCVPIELQESFSSISFIENENNDRNTNSNRNIVSTRKQIDDCDDNNNHHHHRNKKVVDVYENDDDNEDDDKDSLPPIDQSTNQSNNVSSVKVTEFMKSYTNSQNNTNSKSRKNSTPTSSSSITVQVQGQGEGSNIHINTNTIQKNSSKKSIPHSVIKPILPAVCIRSPATLTTSNAYGYFTRQRRIRFDLFINSVTAAVLIFQFFLSFSGLLTISDEYTFINAFNI